jgi:signal transduction histidine kinase/CheY-like chemotaxis protein
MLGRSFLSVVAFVGMFVLSPAGHSSSGVTDVATIEHDLEMINGVEWCRTPLEVSRDVVAAGGCSLKTLTRHDSSVGFVDDAVWLRLKLRNSSAEELEPWLQIGHPRLTYVTVFQQDDDGRWRADRTGYGVPRSERPEIAAYYDVIPVRVTAASSADVWVRIESRARIKLEIRLWDGQAFRGFRQASSAWLAASSGGLLFGLIFSMMMLASSRQAQFGYFALVLMGQFILSLITSGVLLRLVWPDDLPVPIEMMSVGGMLTALGVFGFLTTALPSVKEMPEEYLAIRYLTLAVLGAQLISIFFDYSFGSTIWSTLSVPLLALMTWVAFRAWRQGDTFAIWISIAFFSMMLATAIRVPAAEVNASEVIVDIVAAPISMLVGVALVLMAAVAKSRVLARQLQDAELASSAQVTFLSRMSHELRTPLDTVLGNAQLLMRSSDRLRSAPELSAIVNSGRHLLRMIDEILDYAKGSAGALKLKLELVSLEDFLQSVGAAAQILATRNRNRFEIRCRSGSESASGAVLRLDPGRLRQVLDNLIVNAARHTHDGVITLEYDLRSRKDDTVMLGFSVIDTGDGIALENHARIFEPFERVGRAERYGGKGAGMGLAIVKQLVTLMGGSVDVESTPGSGSVFRFSIVAAPTTSRVFSDLESALRPIEARGYAGRPRVTLVIDDDPGGRAIVAGLLERVGFVVHEAESGNAALRVLGNLDVLDLVVTDQFMPDGDGWTVLEAVYRDRPDIPVVMISAAPASLPEGWMSTARFAAEFLKPVNHNDFLTLIGRLLGLRWTHLPPVARGTDSPPGLRPAAAELAVLREMVELGEVTAMREWVRGLRRRSPEYSGFADRVEASVADLDFEMLQELASESKT